MREFFGDIFQPNQQGQTNAFGSNPNTLSLAGLLQAQGVPQDKAYIMAAGINNERQASQAQQQKLAYDQNQQMQRMQALQGLQGLSQGGDVDQNMLNQQLFSGAFSPGEISSLRDVLNPQPKENVVFNPVTGEALLKQIRDGKVTGFSPIQGGGQQITQGNQDGGAVFSSGQSQSQPYETPVEAKERRAIENDYFKELRNEVKSTNEAGAALKSVEKSLDKVNTGIFSGTKKTIGGLGKEFLGSELGTGASELANIDALSVSLLQPFVAATKGAISDREMALFQSAVPNSKQLPETNRKIIEGMKLTIDRKKEKLRAAEDWRKKGGNINDFETVWADYINANPIISENQKGQVELNKSNVTNWKKELGLSPKKKEGELPKEIQTLSDEELEAIIRG